MPITITGVTGLGGSPPTSLLVTGTVDTCESVIVTTSCSAKPVTVAIPSGGPNSWNAVLPNDKQCPCGATVDVTATIIAIDKTTRDITLKGPKGNWVVVTAGPEVKNFDQMNVGDKVHARYVEAIVLELRKGSDLVLLC